MSAKSLLKCSHQSPGWFFRGQRLMNQLTKEVCFVLGLWTLCSFHTAAPRTWTTSGPARIPCCTGSGPVLLTLCTGTRPVLIPCCTVSEATFNSSCNKIRIETTFYASDYWFVMSSYSSSVKRNQSPSSPVMWSDIKWCVCHSFLFSLYQHGSCRCGPGLVTVRSLKRSVMKTSQRHQVQNWQTGYTPTWVLQCWCVH